jgi:DNA-binding PucR family transcriptional regulator
MATALLALDPEQAGELGMRVLDGVFALDEHKRELLLDTFTAWVDVGGSVDRAARAGLFCHANTVRNRLHRLEELTGLTLSRPRELVELVLAVEALQPRDKPQEPAQARRSEGDERG